MQCHTLRCRAAEGRGGGGGVDTANPAILSRNFWRSVSATAEVSSMMSEGTCWWEMSCASISRAYLKKRKKELGVQLCHLGTVRGEDLRVLLQAQEHEVHGGRRRAAHDDAMAAVASLRYDSEGLTFAL